MRNILTTLLFLFFVISMILPHSTIAQEAARETPKSVVGTGGEASSDTRYQIVGTLGQPLVGITQDLSKFNGIGFWYLSRSIPNENLEPNPLERPEVFRLEQNYPNPFRLTTTIEFEIPKFSAVILSILDLSGKEVAALIDENMAPGVYQFRFTAVDLANGLYFYRVVARDPLANYEKVFVSTKKLMLVK